MIIRSEQMKSFGAAVQREFEARSIAHLRLCFPRLAETADTELLDRVRLAVLQALNYGVRGENDVLRYLEFEVTYGPRFDTKYDAILHILQRADIDGTRKMDALDDWEIFGRPCAAPGGFDRLCE